MNLETVAGDIHFDADEPWQAGAGVDLFTVALHEAGHALGLAHSDRPGSVMYPYYRFATGLSDDDIAGIRKLYGTATAAPPQTPAQPPSQPSQPSQPPPAPPRVGPDTAPPALKIVSPALSIVTVSSASIVISGTATDNAAVAAVRWETSTGSSGTAQGTASWTATVPLLTGTNVVTVRAFDTAGNSSWRSLTVIRR
jgi:hypothetical protein